MKATKLIPTSAGPTVQTTAGELSGALKAKGTMLRFQGIPYAAPASGDDRWRAPQPVSPWTGTRKAVRPGPIAHQRAQAMELFATVLSESLGISKAKQTVLKKAMLLPRKQSEDCLTLNVRAPSHARDLPVMVWIHGGDHTDGSSIEPFYTSDALPERGCVLVTINYRLGLFGFFAHPELADENPDGVAGNYGLLDQIAALEWVRDNISAFGGDPNNVTIFGESAGGEAVLNLMTSPKARGLFHKAIAQSPSDSGRWLHLKQPMLDFDSALDAGKRFADAVVGPQPGQLARLRALPAKELSEAYRAHPEMGRHFYPCVDGVVLPETPMTAFSRGVQAPVPLMIGYNSDEGSLLAPFMHPVGGEFYRELDDPTPLNARQIRETFEKSYGSADRVDRLFAAYPGLDRQEIEAATEHAGDHMFGVHVEHASVRHAEIGQPTYRYHFRSVPPSPTQTAGAFHAAELPHVFGTTVPILPVADDGHLLTRAMGDHWFAFAAQGSPNTPGRPDWPAFDPNDRHQMVFDRPASGPEPCPTQPGLDVMRERIAYLNGLSAGATGDVDLRAEDPVATPGA